MFLTSSILSKVPGITHGFGSRHEPVPRIFSEVWNLKPLWKQVHGNAVASVKNANQDCGEVDGLYTNHLNIPIGVVTADCVPVLLSHRLGEKIASVHAGWRGTRAHILVSLWKKLASEGEKPQDWVAAIGPAIGPCCYEVSEDLANDFAKEFSDFGKEIAVPKTRILDLPAINAEELKRIGFAEVDLIRKCTLCSKDPEFHSYRREGGGTRQLSVIMRK